MVLRRLVVSGGGSRGAWAVGCLYALTKSGRAYETCSGTSVGAILSAIVAQRPTSEALRASECIADATERLRNGIFDVGARLLVASARRGKSTEDKPPPITITISSLVPKDESK